MRRNGNESLQYWVPTCSFCLVMVHIMISLIEICIETPSPSPSISNNLSQLAHPQYKSLQLRFNERRIASVTNNYMESRCCINLPSHGRLSVRCNIRRVLELYSCIFVMSQQHEQLCFTSSCWCSCLNIHYPAIDYTLRITYSVQIATIFLVVHIM